VPGTPDASGPSVDDGGAPPAPPPPAPVDGGDDAASSDAATDGGTFCSHQGTPVFCADFDESTDPTAGWDAPNVPDGGSLADDAIIFESAPRALHATTTKVGYQAAVRRAFTTGTTVTVDVAFLVKTLPPNDSFNVVMLGPNGPTPLYFFFDTGKCYFQDGPDDFSTFLSAPSTSVWHHIGIVVTNGNTVTATFDGVAAWTAHTLPYPWASPTIASLEVGIAGLTTAAAADAWIDDVVVRTQ